MQNVLKTTRRLQRTLLHRRQIFFWKSKSSAISVVKDHDRPLKFLGTEASTWNPRKYRLEPGLDDEPWWKIIMWTGTCTFLLFYFLFFRQRNDIDDELEMPLGKRILQIKEMLLMDEINALKAKGGTGAVYEEDLADIQRLRIKYGYVD